MEESGFMKYILTILLILSSLFLPANAVNFTYKVYDQRVNKSFTAVLGTVTVNKNYYLFAFYTQEGKELCLLGDGITPLDVHNGLVGGMCLPREILLNAVTYASSKEQLLKNVLGWRELSSNTFYLEIDDIREERVKEGLIELKLENR